MKKLGIVLALTLVSAAAQAQPATPSSKLAWDQPNATPTEAATFIYTVYNDGSTAGVTLTSVTCVAGVQSTVCSAPFLAYTPGAHSLTLTASNSAGESGKSAPFAFTFVIVPSTPWNLRVQ